MAAELPVPVYTLLGDAYPTQELTLKHAARFNEVAEQFIARFGQKPTYIARAPGRVNLIGEHIDYALFGVFPTAIEQDILIACAPHDPSHTISRDAGHVNAQNLHPKYAPQSFTPMLRRRRESIAQQEEQAKGEAEDVHLESDWHLEIDTRELRWESYVKAGYYGVLNNYFTASSSGHPKPVDLLVTGTVPPGSGVSSSAAMVVASTLAFLAVNGKLEEGTETVTKGRLVSMAVQNEKRVGVNSGGMDQAASILGTANSALYISFYPSLAAELVTLPTTIPGSLEEEAVFVVANSLVVSDKVVGAKTRYNLRVVETLLAARLLATHLGLPQTFFTTCVTPNRPTLREVVGAFLRVRYPDTVEPLSEESLESGLELLVDVVESLRGDAVREALGMDSAGVPEGESGLTIEEIIKASGMDENVFREVYLSWVDVEATYFQIYKRARHIVTESLRVLEFRDVCLSAVKTATPPSEDDGPSNLTSLKALGTLMNASQESCSKMFECSCPELDLLTRICRRSGALGSRLTGAGWGGCTVSLVPASQVDSFIQAVKEAYPGYRWLGEAKLNEAIFATRPGSGAFVYKLTE
ncbi:galactokinase [Steccherinum ochraceum]|uniref:Galactokinase n=1 Tax=Steccherinum ochraceum TaxID=92696 RepID=A0A4R0R252_9APHY|nr:galactokinase [Steccherinum ochraceum]